MQHIKTHILSKLFTLLLATALLAPSATKFAHTFTHEHHKHDYCKGEKNTHLHELDTDCEFYKFQLNNTFISKFESFNLFIETVNATHDFSQYQFVSDFQKLPFSLRGPPQANLI